MTPARLSKGKYIKEIFVDETKADLEAEHSTMSITKIRISTLQFQFFQFMEIMMIRLEYVCIFDIIDISTYSC